LSKVGFAPGEQPDGTFVLPAAPKPGAGVSAPAPAATGVTQPPSNNGNGTKSAGVPNGTCLNGQANGNGNGYRQPADQRPIHADWAQSLIEQANTLVDCYAVCLAYASQAHGNSVKPEDVRALMTTAFIQNGGKRNGN
jgi:hypothetical protein